MVATRLLYHIETLDDDLASNLTADDIGCKRPGNVGTMQLKLKSGTFATVVDPETGAFQMITTEQPTDLLVALPSSELVGVHPEQSGWYAALRIAHPASQAVERFTEITRMFLNKRVKDGHKRAFVSPFAAESNGLRLLVKVTARIAATAPLPITCLAPTTSSFDHSFTNLPGHCGWQVSECSRRLMHSGFRSPGVKLFNPGDDIIDLYEKPPVGPCTATVHLMGFWYDKTKF